jgi:biotin carboxyl carrier protein
MRWSAALVLLLTACGESVVQAPPRAREDRTTSILTAWVRVRAPDDQAVLEAPARALPDASSVERVSASYSLRVLRVHVTAGDIVEAGAPIVDVSSTEVLGAAAEYEGTRRRLLTERARLAEVRSLRGEGYATAERVFELERQERALEASMRTAAATIRAADMSPSAASRLLGRGAITLRAHVAGVVREVGVVPGDVLVEGGVFATIISGRSCRLEARFVSDPPSESRFTFEDLTGVRTELPGGPARRVDGGEHGGVIVWFDLAPDTAIAPFSEGHIHVTLDAHGYVEVPTAALILRGVEREVVRRRAGLEARVPVTVVMASGASAIVQGDLRTTDDVAADGASARVESDTRGTR